MRTHYWVRASPSDFIGSIPQPRSGHTAVNIGKSKIVFFGGLVDKKFRNDVTVYDIERKLWFQPKCTGSGSDGQMGPSPRAFHIAVAIDCHMFIFGGRLGGNRLGDFWVLDTDIWQWSELTSFGDLPSSRDFAAASPVGNRKIVMYGGWDGKKWLSDVYILDTISLEWTELSVSGTLPPPRCGHSVTMIEKRLLVYGGRGGGGPIMGDLWALKGLIEEGISQDLFLNSSCSRSSPRRSVGTTKNLLCINEENEAPGWTQLKLPGQAPSARCGHTITSGGHYLLLFGGHGTGGWLSRYDIYYNDCVVLDRVSVQWTRLPINNEPPAARAYHSMNSAGSRYLLFGGFDGKSTYGDLWWLVPEDDPITKRLATYPSDVISESNTTIGSQEDQNEVPMMSELHKRLEISISLSNPKPILDEMDDEEFTQIRSIVVGDSPANNIQAVQALRDHWINSSPESITLKELSPLLHDYQRLVARHHIKNVGSNLMLMQSGFPGNRVYRFYHVKDAAQLRLNDIPNLLAEYQELVSSTSAVADTTVFEA